MRKFLLLGVLLASSNFILTAQVNLGEHFGPEEEPGYEDPLCETGNYYGAFDVTGYDVGETVRDFTLFTAEGERFRLGEELGDGKPVVLINGNYTCWRFRDRIAELNSMANFFQGQAKFFIVYTLEAHPYIDVSPYSGVEWTGQRNFDDDILVRQPTTYGERLDVIEEMKANFGIVPQILVDEVCDQWWNNFGPAPNNAYVISPDGRVVFKHSWFNLYPNDMWCELGELLHMPNDYCNDAGLDGDFSVNFVQQGGGTIYGTPGETLTITTEIQNLSNTDNVQVNIEREEVYAPDDWETALCVDVCYNSSVSQAAVTIPPGGSQLFTFYFYTGAEESTGMGYVNFINNSNPENSQVLEFIAVTGVPTSVEDGPNSNWSLFPNPTNDLVQFKTSPVHAGSVYSVHTIEGRLIHSDQILATDQTIDLSSFPAGVYLFKLEDFPNEVKRLVKR